jgi:hypothetical protein
VESGSGSICNVVKGMGSNPYRGSLMVVGMDCWSWGEKVDEAWFDLFVTGPTQLSSPEV